MRSMVMVYGDALRQPTTSHSPLPGALHVGKGERGGLSGILLLGGAGAMHEVVWRPGAGELHAALFQFKSGRGVFILVSLDRFVIDEVGDIQKHLA